MKAFKAFIKPFEAPQRSVKIKIEVNYFPSSEIGAGRVNIKSSFLSYHCLLPFKTKHFLFGLYLATVAIPAGSLPKFGSVRPKQPTISPDAEKQYTLSRKFHILRGNEHHLRAYFGTLMIQF